MISIIIPTLNEENALPQTLSRITEQQSLSSIDHEIIIVDGGSTDSTADIVRSFQAKQKYVHFTQSERGRALQLNTGAQLATGDILLFLHADTLLPKDGIVQIFDSATTCSSFAGCFRHKFSGYYWGLKIVSLLHNWRFKITRIVYGDQAMFISRDLFLELGGFPNQLAEDVFFCKKLITVCKPIMLNANVTTDSRKFEQIGVWRALWQVITIQRNSRKSDAVAHPEFFHDFR